MDGLTLEHGSSITDLVSYTQAWEGVIGEVQGGGKEDLGWIKDLMRKLSSN